MEINQDPVRLIASFDDLEFAEDYVARLVSLGFRAFRAEGRNVSGRTHRVYIPTSQYREWFCRRVLSMNPDEIC